jgi:regulator of sigma E protease
MGLVADFARIILPFLVTLTVLVFIHEMGHYLIARANRIRVEVFSIGFGPEIYGWDDRFGTRWKISWIPLGGYVKFFGDANAASRRDSGFNTMTAQERDVSFHHKPLRQRAAVVAAGPIANFLLAIVLFAGIFSIFGQPFTPAVVSAVVPDSPAETAGLQAGDRIVRIGGSNIDRFEDIQRIVQIRPDAELDLAILRDGAEVRFSVTPRMIEVTDTFGNTHRIGQLGIRSGAVDYVRHDPLTATWYGVKATLSVIDVTFVTLGQMFAGDRGTRDLAGPLGIAQMSSQVAQIGFVASLHFAAFLSVSLGLINLFPIPMLDGGHLLFFSIEALRGKPLSERVQDLGLRFGLLLVVGLLVLGTVNDLGRFNFFGFVSGLFS